MKERRYKMYLMNNKEYIIDESDLKKLKENPDAMLVQLKQVMVHPSSIVAIEPFYIDYKHTIFTKEIKDCTAVVVPGESIPPIPLKDLFQEEILQLSEKMKTI